jgi:hypothetical protein
VRLTLNERIEIRMARGRERRFAHPHRLIKELCDDRLCWHWEDRLGGRFWR